MSDYPRYAAPVMNILRPGEAERGFLPLQNPRIAHHSWLALNFVPTEYYDELSIRLDEIQRQAVHMAAQQLREAGMNEAADLIDPGDGSVSNTS
jgi:hypothetical protein